MDKSHTDSFFKVMYELEILKPYVYWQSFWSHFKHIESISLARNTLGLSVVGLVVTNHLEFIRELKEYSGLLWHAIVWDIDSELPLTIDEALGDTLRVLFNLECLDDCDIAIYDSVTITTKDNWYGPTALIEAIPDYRDRMVKESLLRNFVHFMEGFTCSLQ